MQKINDFYCFFHLPFPAQLDRTSDMKTFTQLLNGLKGTLLQNAWRNIAALPALILFWLSMKRLADSLDLLFTAWRSGTLPVAPAAPAPPVTSSPRPHRPGRSRTPRAPSPPTARTPPSREPATAPARPRRPKRAPAATALPWAVFAPSATLSQKCDILACLWMHALFVTYSHQLSQAANIPPGASTRNAQTGADSQLAA